jgi:hypothetical protein
MNPLTFIMVVWGLAVLPPGQDRITVHGFSHPALCVYWEETNATQPHGASQTSRCVTKEELRKVALQPAKEGAQ